MACVVQRGGGGRELVMLGDSSKTALNKDRERLTSQSASTRSEHKARAFVRIASPLCACFA